MNYMAIPGLKNRSQLNQRSKFANSEIIIEIVLNHFKLTFNQVLEKNRRFEVRYPRQIIMYFLLKNTSMTFNAIGKLFNRDHSTVIHSVNTIQNLIDTEDKKRFEIRSLESFIF